MSTSRDNLRPAVQSGARSSSKVNKRVCPALLAGLLLFGANAKAQTPVNTNVLNNPGAESGLSGWHLSIDGYISAVSTNGLQGGAGSLHLLAHSGSNTFQMFDTTATTAYMYQDFAAAAGSVWSASCYAISYASNYIPASATALMQVAFYNATNGVIASTNSSSGTAGTYGSDVLSAVAVPPVVIAPPMAVDASGWVYLTATNLYNGDFASLGNWEMPLSPPLATNFVAPTNTAYVRYLLQFTNSSTDGGDVYFDDCVLYKIVGSDPDIVAQSGDVTLQAGLTTILSVTAVKALKPETLTYQWQKNGTNLPPGGDIVGDTTAATLQIANLQAADTGSYACVVSDSPSAGVINSIRSVPVRLTVLVLSPIGKRNLVGNPGFEGNPVWSPWSFFNGGYFATAANFYDPAGNVPVNVYDGTTVAISGANGDRDNGFWQAIPVNPGTVLKAAGHAYIPSTNDFIGGNTCRLQIWFKDGLGNTINSDPTYESFKIYGVAFTNADMMYTNVDVSSPNYGQVGFHAQLPRDQWNYLIVSNAVNNSGIGLQSDIPTNTLSHGVFTMPSDAALVNYQVYEYCPVAADPPLNGYPGIAADAVYWDDMELFVVLPVTNLTASAAGNHINLSFAALAGLDYDILYKNNLADANWSVLMSNVRAPDSWATNTASIGDSYPLTVSDTLTASRRFYRVLSH